MFVLNAAKWNTLFGLRAHCIRICSITLNKMNQFSMMNRTIRPFVPVFFQIFFFASFGSALYESNIGVQLGIRFVYKTKWKTISPYMNNILNKNDVQALCDRFNGSSHQICRSIVFDFMLGKIQSSIQCFDVEYTIFGLVSMKVMTIFHGICVSLHTQHVYIIVSFQSWYDYKLRWEPKEYGNVQMLHVPSDHIWRPDIVVRGNNRPPLTTTSFWMCNYNFTCFFPPFFLTLYCGTSTHRQHI